MHIADIELNPEQARISEHWKQAEPGLAVTAQGIHRRSDGTTFPVEVRISQVVFSGTHLVLALARDITERLRTEEALREANHLLQTMIETSPLAIVVLDRTGRVKLWNRAAENIFGWRAEEVLDQPLPTIPEDKQEEFRRLLDEDFQGHGKAGLPLRRQRKDGSLVDVRLWTAPLFDAQGNRWGVMGVMADVTEKIRLEEQLRQAQKMEAIGRLAGGIAHDFNNLLMVICGYVELMLERLPEENPLRRNAQEIHKAAKRAAALTRQLLAFSRKQVLQPRVLDLNSVVTDMEHLLRRLIPENIELTIHTAPNLGAVRADPGQIEQVILNLAVNARDAMPSGGKLLLETANVELDRHSKLTHSEIEPGSYVMLAVSDTGTGMDAETLKHIFEPFFTTKDKSKGTGLGLATVYGVVKQSGGHVTVYSEPGRGSTFKIYLPRVDAPHISANEQQPVRAGHCGNETVLLVEDEDGVRELTENFLRSQGYQVLAARNGEEALELTAKHPGPVHLLLTDVIMPGISGRELAERLAAQRPGIRVLFASGYTDGAVLQQNAVIPGTRFLQKPFPLQVLAKEIRDTLETDPGCPAPESP
jgi:PAS domain S-box-containing protein